MNREKWLKEVDERARKRAEEEAAAEAAKADAAAGILARPAAVAVKHWQEREPGEDDHG